MFDWWKEWIIGINIASEASWFESHQFIWPCFTWLNLFKRYLVQSWLWDSQKVDWKFFKIKLFQTSYFMLLVWMGNVSIFPGILVSCHIAALWTHDGIQLCDRKSCQGCNLQWQNFAVVEFRVSFVEFPQQETKLKVEFITERKMLSSSNIRYLRMQVHWLFAFSDFILVYSSVVLLNVKFLSCL